jgi:hypothetical protein
MVVIVIVLFRYLFLVSISLRHRDSTPAIPNSPTSRTKPQASIAGGFNTPTGYSAHGFAFSWWAELCRKLSCCLDNDGKVIASSHGHVKETR